MSNQTYKERHLEAMLNPNDGEEKTLSNLTRELVMIAYRYKGDTVMLPAVTSLGQCIIKLASDGHTGRIDPSTLIREVEGVIDELGASGDQ